MRDQAGYILTMSDPEAVDAWNRAVTAFLAHGAATPVHLGAARGPVAPTRYNEKLERAREPRVRGRCPMP